MLPFSPSLRALAQEAERERKASIHLKQI